MRSPGHKKTEKWGAEKGMYQVVKRDGKVTEFEISKISKAITKAFEALDKQYHPSVIDMLALRVTAE